MSGKNIKYVIFIIEIIICVFLFWGYREYKINNSDASTQSSGDEQPVGTEPAVQEPKVIYEDLGGYFEGYDACFVLFDTQSNSYTIYNEEKSARPMPPNSTFKIYNSLIGLESGVIKDENTAFKWDGTKHSIEEWNKDHTLQTAFSSSVVWYYKRLAVQVGEKTMQEYIDRLEYGNQDISGGIDRFWLQSTLKITPLQQVELLKSMYNYELPFSKENVDIVKRIMVVSKEGDAVFAGKTGSSAITSNQAGHGWFVGFVESRDKTWFFAVNIQADKDSGGKQAREIAIRILKDKGIL